MSEYDIETLMMEAAFIKASQMFEDHPEKWQKLYITMQDIGIGEKVYEFYRATTLFSQN